MTDLHALPALMFGAELRRRRESAGLTQARLGEYTHYSDALVGLVETGRRLPPERLVVDCDTLFGTDGLLSRLAALARQFGKPAAPLPELLAEARTLRLVDPLLMPDFVQTDDYARALLRAASSAPDAIERWLAERPRLRSLLDNSPGTRAWVVVDETAIYRPIGGHETLRIQLKELLALGETGRVVIQLLPATSPAAALLRAPLVLMSFAEAADVVHLVDVATEPDAYRVERYGDAERHGRDYDLLRAAARSHHDSLARIRAATY